MNPAIIISNYNYDMFVGSAIESGLNQSVPCEIIVVDDASTDNSWDVIQDYVPKGIRAIRLNKNSRGNARGKNVGIALTDAEYITCLDSDDMLLPNSLELRVDECKNNDFVHGWSIIVKGNCSYHDFIKKDKIINKIFTRNGKAKKLIKETFSPRWSFAIEASTVLAHRSLYERFGLYDEEMRWSIDREMWWRWLSHGAKMKIVDKYVSIYRRHSQQLTQDRSRKNPKKCSDMLRDRQIRRLTINSSNTLLLNEYNCDQYIEEIKN